MAATPTRWADPQVAGISAQTYQVGFNLTASGVLVAPSANADTFVRIIGYTISASAALVFAFQSSGATATGGNHYLPANAVYPFAHSPAGWFQSLPGEGLNCVITGTGTVGLTLVYMVMSEPRKSN
ncbi:MAG: hypothetical protein B7Z73_01885 [Planctomycetia bacterium 21-64-5]|nr:MAG: hypothetical protein B7Z73_01885 [Planctomycetia bacterium 21-64-5]